MLHFLSLRRLALHWFRIQFVFALVFFLCGSIFAGEGDPTQSGDSYAKEFATARQNLNALLDLLEQNQINDGVRDIQRLRDSESLQPGATEADSLQNFAEAQKQLTTILVAKGIGDRLTGTGVVTAEILGKLITMPNAQSQQPQSRSFTESSIAEWTKLYEQLAREMVIEQSKGPSAHKASLATKFKVFNTAYQKWLSWQPGLFKNGLLKNLNFYNFTPLNAFWNILESVDMGAPFWKTTKREAWLMSVLTEVVHDDLLDHYHSKVGPLLRADIISELSYAKAYVKLNGVELLHLNLVEGRMHLLTGKPKKEKEAFLSFVRHRKLNRDEPRRFVHFGEYDSKQVMGRDYPCQIDLSKLAP
jgi:hypothetical protein